MHSSRRLFTRVVAGIGAVLVALVALSLLPPTAVTAEQRALTPEELDVEFVRLWNENKLDELGEVWYAEDAIAIPPNHEPIRGRDDIIEFFKELRPTLGELQTGLQPHRVVMTESMTSIVANYATRTGIRFTAHEVFERDADGAWKGTVDAFGLRDPMR